MILEQFVWVTPSMDSRTWCEKFVATDVSLGLSACLGDGVCLSVCHQDIL